MRENSPPPMSHRQDNIHIGLFLGNQSFYFFLIWFLKFVKFFEILVLLSNKYRYELCICVNKEIGTNAKGQYTSTNYYLYYIFTNTGSKII